MRLALLLACLATPALAQDATRHAWGGPEPCVVTLAPCADASCWAGVTLDNRLIGGMAGNPSLTTVTLTLDGLPVVVTVASYGGRTPDVLTVLPPVGYRAEPAEVTVEEDASGTVLIVPVPMS